MGEQAPGEEMRRKLSAARYAEYTTASYNVEVRWLGSLYMESHIISSLGAVEQCPCKKTRDVGESGIYIIRSIRMAKVFERRGGKVEIQYRGPSGKEVQTSFRIPRTSRRSSRC